MREQIKVLEHIADVNPLAQNFRLFQLIQLVSLPTIANVIAIDLNKTLIDAFQMVDGTQECGFP